MIVVIILLGGFFAGAIYYEAKDRMDEKRRWVSVGRCFRASYEDMFNTPLHH